MFDSGTMFSKTELGSIFKSTLHYNQNGKVCKKKSALNGTYVVVANNSCLNGRNAHSNGKNHIQYWNPSLIPGASEVMDLRKESTTTTLPNQHNSLLQILNLLLIPTDKCSYHYSAQRPRLTENRDHPRKPHLDTKQRSIDHGKCRSNRHSCSTALTSMVQRTSMKMGLQDYNSRILR